MDNQYQILEFLEILNPNENNNLLLAKDIYMVYGSVYEFFTAAREDVQKKIPGIDAAFLNRVRRLYKLILNMTRTQLIEKPVLNSLDVIKSYLSLTQFHEKKEYFRVLFLNEISRLLSDEIMEEGSERYVPVNFRKIAARSLELGASKLLLVHNHPSGKLEFSTGDKRSTIELAQMLQPLCIEILNHALITSQGIKFLKKALQNSLP
jgi:DNA repair proteins